MKKCLAPLLYKDKYPRDLGPKIYKIVKLGLFNDLKLKIKSLEESHPEVL